MRPSILAAIILVLGLNGALAGDARGARAAQESGQAVSSVTVSDPQIVIQNNEINPNGGAWKTNIVIRNVDTVLSVIHKGGAMYWLNSHGNGNYAIFEGTTGRPFGHMVTMMPMYQAFNEAAPQGLPDGTKPKYWIVNTYQAGDFILAFVHVEYTDKINNNHGRVRIGLAVSKDYGKSFQYLGHILAPQVDDLFNMEGAPYIVKDGYFYVYASERCSTPDAQGGAPAGKGRDVFVARARVADVLAAARAGRVTPWNKYNGGDWQSPGLGGACSGLPINPVGITHSDAAYSTYTKTYFLTLSMRTARGARDTWVNLYESKDGIHWNLAKTIADLPPAGLKAGFQYVTIVDGDGSDNAEVGKKFYVYSAGETANSGMVGVVYRWTVELN